jgi:hypothetical protein
MRKPKLMRASFFTLIAMLAPAFAQIAIPQDVAALAAERMQSIHGDNAEYLISQQIPDFLGYTWTTNEATIFVKYNSDSPSKHELKWKNLLELCRKYFSFVSRLNENQIKEKTAKYSWLEVVGWMELASSIIITREYSALGVRRYPGESVIRLLPISTATKQADKQQAQAIYDQMVQYGVPSDAIIVEDPVQGDRL